MAEQLPLAAEQSVINLEKDPLVKADLLIDQSKAHLEFIEAVWKGIISIREQETMALFAIRKELEINIDEKVYRQALERSIEESNESLRLYLDKLRKLTQDQYVD